MLNQTAPSLEHKVLVFALGEPGLGPRRLAAQMALPQWGGWQVSPTTVHSILRRHGLNTRRKRLALVAGYASPPEPERAPRPVPLHLEAEHPGDLVQFDCFHIGRLGSQGECWQYTALDVASSYMWAEVHQGGLNPEVRHTAALVRRVADELRPASWKLEAVTTDNGSEFRAQVFRNAVLHTGAKHRFIPCRPSADQWLRRAGPAHRARGMLAPHLRTLPGGQAHRPKTRPRRLPQLLQLGPRPHRQKQQQTTARDDGLRF